MKSKSRTKEQTGFIGQIKKKTLAVEIPMPPFSSFKNIFKCYQVCIDHLIYRNFVILYRMCVNQSQESRGTRSSLCLYIMLCTYNAAVNLVLSTIPSFFLAFFRIRLITRPCLQLRYHKQSWRPRRPPQDGSSFLVCCSLCSFCSFSAVIFLFPIFCVGGTLS